MLGYPSKILSTKFYPDKSGLNKFKNLMAEKKISPCGRNDRREAGMTMVSENDSVKVEIASLRSQ